MTSCCRPVIRCLSYFFQKDSNMSLQDQLLSSDSEDVKEIYHQFLLRYTFYKFSSVLTPLSDMILFAKYCRTFLMEDGLNTTKVAGIHS